MQRPELAPHELDAPDAPPRPSCAARCGCVRSGASARRATRRRSPRSPRSEDESSRALSAAIGPSSSSIPRVSVAMVCAVTRPSHLRDVDLRHAERRMREHVGELAVVREHEQPAGVGIQSPDVVEALRPVLDESAQIGPAALVAHRADHAAGLVEHDVALGLVELDGGAVDVDQVGLGIDARCRAR